MVERRTAVSGPERAVRGMVSTRRRGLTRQPTSPPPTKPPWPVAVRALVAELRPVQWVKNFACLAGLIFSGRLFIARHEAQAVLGFWSFCFASSAVYILNDYLDREKDRLNPRTAGRPLASGDLPLWLAGIGFLVMVGAAGAGAARLGTSCGLTLAAYGLLNVLYSLRLKEIVIADVMCIALGFVLRVLFGVYAVGVLPTPWIALCMFFLALFLGFAKRKAELAALASDPARARPVLAKYEANYLNMLVVMSATLAILCYALFTVASHKNPTLVVTVVPVVYCISRYILQVTLNGRGESPDRTLLSDSKIWAGIIGWLACYILIVYGNIHLFAPMD